MTCDDMTTSLGVYVIGALAPVERLALDEHLATCAACRSELAELETLPGLLDRLTLDDLAPEPEPPSEELYERVAARARAEIAAQRQPTGTVSLDAARRRRRHRLLSSVAAVGIVVAGALGGWAVFGNHDADSPGGPVRMSVSLAAQTTGTSYTVSVSGLPTDEHCKLIAVATDGRRVVAGRWDATYDGEAKETGSTTIPRSELSQLILLGSQGQRLAAVTV